MGTQLLAVYSTGSGMLRYIVDVGDDSELPQHAKRIWPGESATEIGRASVKTIDDVAAAVSALIGKPLPSPVRAAVIDEQGVVVAVALIDPLLDPILPPNARKAVVLSDVAEVGWEVGVGGSLEAPVKGALGQSAP